MPTVEWTEGDLNANRSNQGFAHDQVGPNPSDDYIRRGYTFGSITRGLIAYYPLDGNVNDATPLSNDASNNGATFNGSGEVGSDALSFDGTDDFLDTTVEPPSRITLAFWISTTTTNDFDILASNTDVGTDDGFRLHTGTNSDAMVFIIWNGGGDDRITGGDINDGSFHHVAVTNPSSGMRTYVDGSLVASNSIDAPLLSNSQSILIADDAEASNNLNGVFDDIRIYDRALSQPEVNLLASIAETSEVVEEDVI